MPGNFEIKSSAEENPLALKSKQMDLDAGFLGRVFGSGRNAPMNIGGFLVVVLLTSGVVVLFTQSAIPAAEYWKIIAPLITLVMGYVFGKSSGDG